MKFRRFIVMNDLAPLQSIKNYLGFEILTVFNIRPLVVLLQPPIISSKAISLLLFAFSSLSYSKAIIANGGLGLTSVKSILTKANDLKE
jgi:hypothetical protein